MHWSHALFLAVVFFIGVPASLKNWTARALVVSALFAEGVWLLSGERIDTLLHIISDWLVIVVILMKRPPHESSPCNGLVETAQTFWRERTDWDKVVLVLFGLMLPTYILSMDAYYRWWILWTLALMQFFAAGAEAFAAWQANRRAPEVEETSGLLRLELGHV